MAAPQIYNFQTYYTVKKDQLDDDLQYYKDIDENPDEYAKPRNFRGLYKLAWDYFALKQDSEHNRVIYAGVAPPPALAADRVPAEIDTVNQFREAMNLYCKNMGMVIGAKILFADNIDQDIEWVKENGVFQATLPVDQVTFTATAPGAVGVAKSGAEVIYDYANDFYQSKPDHHSNIGIQLLLLLDAYSKTFFENAQAGRECEFFQAQMVAFNNVGGLDNGATILAYAAAEQAYLANADTGERFNGSMFLKNLLLNMTRNTVLTRQTYNHVKTLLNSTSTSFSSVKEIESNIGTFDNETDVAVAPVQVSEKTTSIFTGVGFNTILDQLKTKMPRRLTHRCVAGCNDIYTRPTPVVRVMSYKGTVYVAPIQTRGDRANTIVAGTEAGLIVTFGATAVIRPGGLSPGLPYKAIFTRGAAGVAGTAGTIDILDRLNGMPGPNPQPLNTNKVGIISTDYPSECTTGWDLENMRLLPSNFNSMTNVAGHGDWQSMPNYATCWLIKHSDKSITMETGGVDLTPPSISSIKVFPFQQQTKWFGSTTGSQFAIPYDRNNCVLPPGWEMFAMWPTGKLLYRNGAEFVVDPPKRSYWKEWRSAVYDCSYMAEIGYQEAKAAYEEGITARTQRPLSLNDQVESFQMSAHKKMEEYADTIQKLHLGGIVHQGGSRNKKLKRYNKKTMMSILKTAKRKYFTRRNKSKR
jgi:hypothetical protein